MMSRRYGRAKARIRRAVPRATWCPARSPSFRKERRVSQPPIMGELIRDLRGSSGIPSRHSVPRPYDNFCR